MRSKCNPNHHTVERIETVRAVLDKAGIELSGEWIDLDFHAIPFHGEDALIERRVC